MEELDSFVLISNAIYENNSITRNSHKSYLKLGLGWNGSSYIARIATRCHETDKASVLIKFRQSI